MRDPYFDCVEGFQVRIPVYFDHLNCNRTFADQVAANSKLRPTKLRSAVLNKEAAQRPTIFWALRFAEKENLQTDVIETKMYKAFEIPGLNWIYLRLCYAFWVNWCGAANHMHYMHYIHTFRIFLTRSVLPVISLCSRSICAGWISWQMRAFDVHVSRSLLHSLTLRPCSPKNECLRRILSLGFSPLFK